jgi:hypothetical protein
METRMSEQITEATSTHKPAVKRLEQRSRPKADTLRKLLSRRHGATIAQIQKQLSWQPHPVRAAISRLRSSGLSIDLDRSGRVTRYRVLSGDEQ